MLMISYIKTNTGIPQVNHETTFTIQGNIVLVSFS